MDPKFPYLVMNLAIGPLRVVYAPDDGSVAIPTKIQDIQAMVMSGDDYPLQTGYDDFGAAVNPPSYSRSNSQNDLTLQNETIPIDTEVTAVARAFGFNVAEIGPVQQQILEQAPDIETIAAASGASAQKAVGFGSFDQLDRYRVFMIGERKKKAGIVVEPGGLERGRLFAVGLYSAALAGDAQSMSFDRNNFASTDVTFNGYTDDSAPAGKDHGTWLFEDAGTIA